MILYNKYMFVCLSAPPFSLPPVCVCARACLRFIIIDSFKFLTGKFVADKLAAFDLAYTGEERTDFILRHTLRQIIYDEIRLRLLLRCMSESGSSILLYDSVHSVRHHCTPLRGRH